ncbi:MAG: SDR family oxidoreductase [Bacteroidales bacterium]
MTKLKDKTVLITGGASGIGRLMGNMCLHDGARQLIIWDINKEKLEETARELRTLHFTVHPYVVNVANVSEVIENARKIRAEIGDVDILINNAGIITGNRAFKDFTHTEIDKIMAVNTGALLHVTLEFLPAMIRKGSGHVVNISSAAGMLSNPLMSVYCASKWAVSGWSESMRMELESGRTGVKVTTVNPSYIDTGMFKGVKVNPIMPLLKPDELAGMVIRAIKSDRLFVRAPFMVKLVPFVKGILPVRLFDLVVGNWLGVYSSMKEFKGHGGGGK